MRSQHAILGALVALTLFTTTTVDAQATATSGSPLVTPIAPAAPVTPATPVYQYAYAAPQRGPRPIVGYRTEMRSPPAIWGTGLGLFLAGWVLDFAVLTPIANVISNDRAGADEQDAWAWSLIPIAGPVIQLGVGAPHPAIPILTGLLQVGGLVTFIVGVATRESHRAAIHQGDPDDPSMPTVELDAAPLEGGGMIGLTIRHL